MSASSETRRRSADGEIGTPPTPSRAAILDPQAESAISRTVRRVRRHIYWARTQGIRRVIEEDELNPVARLSLDIRRRSWQRAHPQPPGSATPVYLVGLQRSGTNMLARSLAASLEFDVHNENDRRIFNRFLLRSDRVIETTVEASRSRYVLFKPLCDSHRVVELLDGIATPSPGRAIWMARSMGGRLRSAVDKFGDVNRQVLAAIADGSGMHTWQAGGLSEPTLGFLRSFDFESMSARSAAALFWLVRNDLYFELGLDQRPDVAMVYWDSLVEEPERYMTALCGFLGLAFRPEMIAGIEPRRPGSSGDLDIDPRIAERGADLEKRLREAGARCISSV
jgi:hypothetical protein